jgi:hypothetical protein
MIKKGICNCTVMPIRHEPSEASEMITQLLFGETLEIVVSHNNWALIKADYDGYCGWIDSKAFKMISKTKYKKITSLTAKVLRDLYITAKSLTTNENIHLIAGSSIYPLKGKKFFLDDELYVFNKMPTLEGNHDKRIDIIDIASKFLNIPYLWGGRSTFGIDCSGFVQTVFKIAGIKLPRDSSQQALNGHEVTFINEAKPGDLAFFNNDEGKIIHTGIILSHQKIIHASGRVRIDKIDHTGIYDEMNQSYSHELKLIKNVIIA